MARKVALVPGSVVSVDLGDGAVAFARVLLPPLFEFFELSAAPCDQVDIGSVVRSGVLFRIDVMNAVVESGRWPVIGVVPLSADEVARREVFFKQNAISGAFSLYSEDRVTKQVFSQPATFEECEGLERAAVWDASHVEDRLRDYFSGRPNKWVESLKPRQKS